MGVGRGISEKKKKRIYEKGKGGDITACQGARAHLSRIQMLKFLTCDMWVFWLCMSSNMSDKKLILFIMLYMTY